MFPLSDRGKISRNAIFLPICRLIEGIQSGCIIGRMPESQTAMRALKQPGHQILPVHQPVISRPTIRTSRSPYMPQHAPEQEVYILSQIINGAHIHGRQTY
jgi:hypothetical protein